MAIIHALRSDSATFDARFSYGGKTPGFVLQNSAVNTPLYEADASAIGGNRINMDRSAAIARALTFNAARIKTVSTSRAISILLRVKLGANGTALGMWGRDSMGSLNWGSNRLQLHVNSSNQWLVTALNEFGQNCLSGVNFGTQNVGTSDYVDVVFTWTGDTTANGAKVYINGSLLGQATATAALASTFDWSVCQSLWIGGVASANNTRYYVNEFVVWDSVIDPTSVALTSGTGSLNGVSRTAFVDVAAFDALNSVGAGASNIRSGVSETINGVTSVGTMIAAAAATTKIGVSADDGTGTYDGSERYTDFGNSNIRSGQSGKYNSATNNRTGTVVASAAATTKIGVTADDGTGTYDASERYTDFGNSNIRAGTAGKYNSTTNNRLGTLNNVTNEVAEATLTAPSQEAILEAE